MSGQHAPCNATLAFVAGHRKVGETGFTCALCGCRFTHAGLACGSCPLKAGCDVVQCPHCGFQFPRTSGAVEWARRLLRVFRSEASLQPPRGDSLAPRHTMAKGAERGRRRREGAR